EAAAAEVLLDAALAERDEVQESIERLRKHEGKLAYLVAQDREEDRTEAQAAFRAALTEAIRSEATAVRRFAALIALDSEFKGRMVSDLGRLMLEYLSGEFRHSAMSGDTTAAVVWARVRELRAAFERGEALR
ncbi:MAG TPA: hypothetical protein VD838_00975, partial [Anaeromyxobacteraceae bacterium]|nr:hypothetical protein [Anaeromyxobacteraceae bacterium]